MNALLKVGGFVLEKKCFSEFGNIETPFNRKVKEFGTFMFSF
jgi:hypothetical protein